MKNTFSTWAACALATSMAVGCAEGATDPNADPQIDAAFLGLTLVDCQEQATECLEANLSRRWFERRRPCVAELTACTGEAAVDTAQASLAEVGDILECADAGADCFQEAGRVSDAVVCEQEVEACTLETVADLTGIQLPTSGEVVEQVVETTGEVVEIAVEVTGEVVETAVEVTGEVVETAVGVTGEVVETAVEVVETGVEVVRTAADCGRETRQCLRNGGGFFSCRSDYRDCMRNF